VPEYVYVCHCNACQRRTGAVVHSGSRWRKTRVRIEGDNKIYARMADSGFEIRFHFCPNCGSNVYWEGDRAPRYYGIAVGSFADPGFSGAELFGVGGGDAPVAGPAASNRSFC